MDWQNAKELGCVKIFFCHIIISRYNQLFLEGYHITAKVGLPLAVTIT